MIRRWLQIREGESRRAFLLFAYLFLVIASAVVTKTSRDAIFQEKFGSGRLPYADLASAVCVGLVMAVYVRVYRRVGLRGLLIGTLLVTAAGTAGFWFVARVREPLWLLRVLYVWASVTAVLLPAQVWTLANRLMTTREARRLFGIVSSGAICGGIFGGLVTRAIVRHSDTADLLLPTAAALAICPIFVVLLWRERAAVAPDGAAQAAEPADADLPGVRQTLATIWQSPHLRSVAALIGIAAIVTTIASWQYKALAQIYYPDTDQRTAFYGLFTMWFGILALAMQLFLSSRLLRRFGVGVALLVVPVALIATSIGLLASSALWAAILLRGSDQVIRYSIDKSTVELLYLPIPARQLMRVKALIDTLVQRTGDGVGALLLVVTSALFISNPTDATEVGAVAVRTSVVTLVLLGGWIAAARSARRHYVESLRDSIATHRPDVDGPLTVAGDRAITDLMTAALVSGGNPDEVTRALLLLEHHDPPVSHPAVPGLLGHASAQVRRHAVAVLSLAEDTGAVARVEPLVKDPDEGVRAEALVYLSKFGSADPLTYLTELDEVHGSAVASAITHFLSRPGPAQNVDAVRVLLQAATGGDDSDRHAARLEAAQLIESLPDRFEAQLNALLQDQAPDVVRMALKASIAVGKPSSIALIVTRLADGALAADAAETLVNFGNRAIPTLRQALGQDHPAAGVRHAIPDVLDRIGTAEAERLLVDYLLDPDPMLRLCVVSALNRLRQATGDRRLEQELVETVLAAEILGHYRSCQLLGRLSAGSTVADVARAQVRQSMHAEMERIFRLIKLLLPDQEIYSAYLGLQSDQPVVRANALEFLDHALPDRFRTLLLPLIDGEVPLEQRIAIADRMVGAAVESSAEAVAAFAASDELLRELARHAEARLGQAPAAPREDSESSNAGARASGGGAPRAKEG